jgi:hypothetical protein
MPLATPPTHHLTECAPNVPAPPAPPHTLLPGPARHLTERAPESSQPILPPLASHGTLPSILCLQLDTTMSWQPPTLQPTSFKFEWTTTAAQHNLDLLAAHHYDLGRAIAAQPGSIMTPGAEFCPILLLRPICGNHPLWHLVEEWLSSEVTFPTSPIADAERIADLHAMIARGNHQSAKQRAPALEK